MLCIRLRSPIFSTYEKMNYDSKNVQNVLYELLTQKLIVPKYKNDVLKLNILFWKIKYTY